jgi:hypothetical protein
MPARAQAHHAGEKLVPLTGALEYSARVFHPQLSVTTAARSFAAITIPSIQIRFMNANWYAWRLRCERLYGQKVVAEKYGENAEGVRCCQVG